MIIYLAELALIVFAWPISKYKFRFRSFRKDMNGESVYLTLVFVVLGLVMALRSYHVGTDSEMYYDIYRKIAKSKSINEALRQSTISYAPLYVLNSYILSKIFQSNQIYFIVNSFIISCGFYNFIRKSSRNYMFSSLLFMLLTLYFESMNGMRQFVAISLTLNAFILMKDNIGDLKAWILYGIAVMTHITALVFILAFVAIVIINRAQNVDKVVLITIIGCIFTALLFKPIVILITSKVSSMVQYVDGTNSVQIFSNNGGGRISILYSFLLLITVYIIVKIRHNNSICNKVDYTYIPPLLFCSIYGIVFSKNILFCRILWYFLSLYISFLPNMYNLLFIGKRKQLIYLITTSILLIYFIFHLIEDKSGIIPYSFFWNV